MTKNIKEVKESTKNLGEVLKKTDREIETPTHLAIEKTQPSSQTTQNQSIDGVILDLFLYNTLQEMNRSNILFKIFANPESDLIWNSIEMSKLGGYVLRSMEGNIFHLFQSFRKFLQTQKKNSFTQKSSEDKVNCWNTLGSFNYEQDNPKRGEASGCYNYIKCIRENNIKNF